MKRVIFLSLFFLSCTTTKYHYGTGYYAPCWNADGTRIYYFRNDLTVKEKCPYGEGCICECEKNEWYICSCKPDGSDRKEIYKVAEFSGDGGGGIMDVSPEGKIIYSFPKTKQGIWMTNTSGSSNNQILTWGLNPRWAYNYTKIVYEGEGNNPGIWIMDKDGTNLSQVLTEGLGPAFCDANEKVAYHKGGYIWIYSFADSSNDSITEGSWADWSNNGESFMYWSYYQGYYREVLYNLLDSTVTLALPYLEDRVRWSITDIIVGEVSNSGIGTINIDGSDFKIIIEGE